MADNRIFKSVDGDSAFAFDEIGTDPTNYFVQKLKLSLGISGFDRMASSRQLSGVLSVLHTLPFIHRKQFAFQQITVDDTTPYADGDLIADPVYLAFTDVNDMFVELVEVSLINHTGGPIPIDLLVYYYLPSDGITANDPYEPSDPTDIQALIRIAAEDYSVFVTKAYATKSVSFLVPLDATGGVWVVPVARGALTYVGTTDLEVRFTAKLPGQLNEQPET